MVPIVRLGVWIASWQTVIWYRHSFQTCGVQRFHSIERVSKGESTIPKFSNAFGPGWCRRLVGRIGMQPMITVKTPNFYHSSRSKCIKNGNINGSNTLSCQCGWSKLVPEFRKSSFSSSKGLPDERETNQPCWEIENLNRTYLTATKVTFITRAIFVCHAFGLCKPIQGSW